MKKGKLLSGGISGSLNDFLEASAQLADGSSVCSFVLRKVIARKLDLNLQVFIHSESRAKGKGVGYSQVQ